MYGAPQISILALQKELYAANHRLPHAEFVLTSKSQTCQSQAANRRNCPRRSRGLPGTGQRLCLSASANLHTSNGDEGQTLSMGADVTMTFSSGHDGTVAYSADFGDGSAPWQES